jgi:hypothetical protein
MLKSFWRSSDGDRKAISSSKTLRCFKVFERNSDSEEYAIFNLEGFEMLKSY